MSDLRIDRADGTSSALRVRMDRPERRNALTLSTVEHLYATLDKSPAEVLMLGSTTADIFSAGADLDIDDTARVRMSDLLYACYERAITRPGPVIAVVEGAAVGGGAQLSAAADLRVASPGARWRWVGPGHGLAVGAWILPDLLGRSRGLDLAFTARWLGVEEATSAGFTSRVDDDPWTVARDLAVTLEGLDADALARAKQIATRPELLEALRHERERNYAAWSGHAAPRHEPPAAVTLDDNRHRCI